MTTKTKMVVNKNGNRAMKTLPGEIPAIADTTKRPAPTGGVNKPSTTLIQTMTPK